MWTVHEPPLPPTLCANPTSGLSFNCLAPSACPLICLKTSTICPIPDAPVGCPLLFNPPLVLIGFCAFKAVIPSAAAFEPSPLSKKPTSSTMKQV